jgi:tRNA-Thr(GGU) m(6)t(6)A37 methyltransferase TsaA
MNRLLLPLLAGLIIIACRAESHGAEDEAKPRKQFAVYAIGWVRKAEGRTTIVVDKKYQPGLLGLDQFSHVWVLYWFDRNDTPEKRSILQVHPQGKRENPIRGVFATHSPVRPNLIAMSRCKIISVKENVIEIESIDAFPDTPVLDLKN